MSIIREKRAQAELGQEQLARLAGISVFKLSRIESGKQPLHVPEAIAIASVLKCSPIELLPELHEALVFATHHALAALPIEEG